MSDYSIPPVRFDSPPMDARTLSQQIDWGLRERSMPEIWKRSTGAGVLVIVLDTGVPQHSDLPTPVFEFNFTNSPTRFDRNSHQTHCAGIIAAKNNSDGVVGWAPDADLGHIKVLSDQGQGFSSWIESGIRQAINEWKNRRHNYVGCVISLSLGGDFDQSQESALRAATEAGIVVVAATGNSGFRGGGSTVAHPGSSKFTIGVAAYRNDGNIARFSSGGPEVDIAMPGENILSTVPGNRYQVMSGTSMATPAAAGLIACVLSSRPLDSAIRKPESLRELFRKHSEDRGTLGKDNRFGFGVPKPNDMVRDDEYWFF